MQQKKTSTLNGGDLRQVPPLKYHGRAANVCGSHEFQ